MRGLAFGAALGAASLGLTALAAPRPPHDASNGVTCADCHIGYAELCAPEVSQGGASMGSTTTRLVDASKSWAALAWSGGAVTFTSGANAGKSREVVHNTATTLQWSAPLPAPPAVGDTYKVGRTSYDDVETKCRSCHNPTGRAASMPDVGQHLPNDGAVRIGCGKCHDPHNLEPSSGQGNALIRTTLRWPSAAGPVAYPSGGVNPALAGAPSYDGICEICHTATTQHRNSAAGGHEHETGSSCTSCHPHASGFRASCAPSCHGTPTPEAEDYPGGGGAHAKHVTELGLGCTTCHYQVPHGEGGASVSRGNVQVVFAPKSFPGGTTSANAATALYDAGSSSCQVGCHNPVLASPAAEAPTLDNVAPWTEGSLRCSDCHDSQLPMMTAGAANGVTYQRGHLVANDSPTSQRADCGRCHDQAVHTRGTTVLKRPDGSTEACCETDAELDRVCRDCHDRSGASLSQRAPHDAVTGYDTSTGDFRDGDKHGVRAGTGFGGTLAAPYARGAAPLACAACHDKHGSPHAFNLKTVVNGVAVAGPISRAGRNAEQLCRACHRGTYHQGCAQSWCHSSDPVPPPQACFHCHTHEGIRNWPRPDIHDAPGCEDHCHGGPWFPWGAVNDTTAPTITVGPTATVFGSLATVTWTTNEASSSYVEWGLTCCSDISGSSALVTWHTVQLSGLPTGSSLGYRVRSEDAAHNEVVSSVGQIGTAITDRPTTPVLVDRSDVESATAIPVTLSWAPSSDPNGDPIEYAVEVDDDYEFGSVDYGSGWITSTGWTVTVAQGPVFFWRVMARDAAHPTFTSAWSSVDTFGVSQRPSAPVLVAKVDYVAAHYTPTTLSWSAAPDPDGEVVQYYVEVSTVATFATITYKSTWISATQWTFSPLSSRTYHWRVTARDSVHPTLSSTSAVDSFFLAVTDPPTTPVLIAQPDVGAARPTSITLQWNASTDPNGNPVQYQVEVDNLATFASVNYRSSWLTTTSWTFTIANATTWYWRVKARDGTYPTYTSSWSDVGSFDCLTPPPAPTLVHVADVVSATAADVVMTWNAVIAPDGDAADYEVQVDDASDFSSPLSTVVAGTSALFTLSPGRYVWRVKARDATHPTLTSAWSASDSFGILSSAAPPAPVLIDEPNYDSGGWDQSITFEWNPVVDPDGDPVEYQVQVYYLSNFAGVSYQSAWQAATSWSTVVWWGMTFYWRVMARDALHPEALSPWSVIDGFTDLKSSCPFIYVWDGSEYRYATDIQGEIIGLPANSSGAKNAGLYGPATFVLDGLVPNPASEYVIKIREALTEIDYVDVASLWMVEHPSGTQVVSSSAENTYTFGYTQPLTLYTVEDAAPPQSALDRFGGDVSEALSECDGVPAPAGRDVLEYYELDFGPVVSPEHTKLVLDGWSFYGSAFRGVEVVQPFIEVPDGSGGWVEARKFAPPAGDAKTLVVDLGGVWHEGSHAMRVHLGLRSGARWVIDCARLDDSPPAPLTIAEAPRVRAELRHRGALSYTTANFEHRITARDDEQPDNPGSLGNGRFTRLGDVSELVAELDDRFVIMLHGDELELAFAAPPPPPAGTTRTLLLEVDVYYKGSELAVEPLPFHGMSAYPYPAGESYPSDAEHLLYLEQYNTRVLP